MDGLLDDVAEAVGRLDQAGAADVARAAALAGHALPPGLAPALETRIADSGDPHTIAGALWAFGSLGHPPDDLLARTDFGTAVAPRLPPRPAAAAAWGLAAAGRGGGPHAAALASRLDALGPSVLCAKAGAAGLRQVHWAALAATLLGEEGAGGGGRPVDAPSPAAAAWAAARPELLSAAADTAAAVANSASLVARQSALQAAVVGRVGRVVGQRAVVPEGVCPLTGLAVDALLPAEGLAAWDGSRFPRGVALEVDGPTHFYRGAAGRVAGGGGPAGAPPSPASSRTGGHTPRQPTAATALKRRLLGAAGWAVVAIDGAAWTGLGSGAEEDEFVRGALRAVGAVR